MALEFLGETYIKERHHYSTFLFGNKRLDELKKRKIIVWGCDTQAWIFTEKARLLGIEIYAYCDNDKRLCKDFFLDKTILTPKDAIDFAKSNNGYFILTMSNKYLDIALRKILNRFGTEFSICFNNPMGNYFWDKQTLNTVTEAVDEIIQSILFRKKLNWFDCVRGMKFNDFVSLPIMSTKFWDNFIQYIYNNNLRGTILDIGPGYGTFSLICKKIYKNDIDWLCYSFDEKIEDDYILPHINYYPVKRIFGEIQNPEFYINDKYDIIVFCEVMEHFLYNPLPTVKKISTWLKDDGVIFFSTPTPESDGTCIYDSFDELPDYDNSSNRQGRISNYLDQSEEHQYIYSEKELRKIFEECGLRVVEYIQFYKHHRFILKKN